MGIGPGETKKLSISIGKTDSLYSSKNGFRSMSIWVDDNDTVVEAHWEKECQGGIGNWKTVGKEIVKGKNVKFSRAVYLKGGENLKLTVKGVKTSPGKKSCYYHVNCEEYHSIEQKFHSNDFLNPDTWFAPDKYLRWYWCGCTCYVVLNVIDKEMLLIDAYVSKATLGDNKNYRSLKGERKRIVKWLNVIRHFVARGYTIRGILSSHEHGDHIGDLPYLLGGIKSEKKTNFLGTGLQLTGKNQTGRIPVMMSYEAFTDPFYHHSDYDEIYTLPKIEDVDFPYIYDINGKISGRAYKKGQLYNYGMFEVTPYVWYHGQIADGFKDDRRVLGYLIQRSGTSADIAKIFLTTGYCERSEQVEQINEEIGCHHLIFAHNGKEETGSSAQKVKLLADSPVNKNFIFTSHSDKNSLVSFKAGDDRNTVTDLFGWFIQSNIVSVQNEKTHWQGQERTICIGYWGNRIGD